MQAFLMQLVELLQRKHFLVLLLDTSGYCFPVSRSRIAGTRTRDVLTMLTRTRTVDDRTFRNNTAQHTYRSSSSRLSLRTCIWQLLYAYSLTLRLRFPRLHSTPSLPLSLSV